MGKSWDNTGIAYNIELWKECLRVLKPGGYLLAFSGTRTYHRMAVAIEDAGFEIRDMIEWVYGSGFPKSLNVGKAVDKLGNNPYGWLDFADTYKKIVEESNYNHNDIDKYLGIKASSCYWARKDNRGGLPPRHHWEKIKEFIGLDGRYDELYNEVEREVLGQKEVMGKDTDLIYGKYKGGTVDITKGTSEWEGWGTALKPAHEPICMARKPLAEKTVAENCLKWGTGGINIDESRVGLNGEKTPKGSGNKSNGSTGIDFHGGNKEEGNETSSLGRFPANLIHDNSDEVRGCFPETKAGVAVNRNRGARIPSIVNYANHNGEDVGFNNSGNASRFFKSIIYEAKPSKAERNRGCEAVFNLFEQSEGTKQDHPTVKPIALMEYLIKMVTPKGGVVLDPFNGSGTTGCAAVKNGFDYIGIDITPEYITISEKRIKSYQEL